MRTDVQRNDKYQAKYVAATVNLKVAARLDGMKSSYATLAAALYVKEQQAQGILTAVSPAIQTTLFPFYYAFVRQVFKVWYQGMTGAALDAQAQVAHDKWESTGLASAVMIDLALNLFGATVT
jgi:hypothetical protein